MNQVESILERLKKEADYAPPGDVKTLLQDAHDFIYGVFYVDPREEKDVLGVGAAKRRLFVLERRRKYLGERIDRFDFSEGAGSWVRAEWSALEWALPILYDSLFPAEKLD